MVDSDPRLYIIDFPLANGKVVLNPLFWKLHHVPPLRQVIDFSSLVNWVTGEKHIGTIDESGEAQMAVRDEVRITLSRARRFCDKLFAGSFRQEF